MMEERCSKSLEKAKVKGIEYHQLLQKVEGKSYKLGACFQDIAEWTVANDCLEAKKFECGNMWLAFNNLDLSF